MSFDGTDLVLLTSPTSQDGSFVINKGMGPARLDWISQVTPASPLRPQMFLTDSDIPPMSGFQSGVHQR